jgi:Excalibur calcium-binding domain
MMIRTSVGLTAATGIAACMLGMGTAGAAAPALYKNCTNFNKRYPHGVGKLGARDRTSGGDDPVTNFKRSTVIYNRAMSYNRGLDRDKDRIACEKH